MKVWNVAASVLFAVSSAFASAAVPTALPPAFKIDPLASVPFVTQQLQSVATAPEFWGIRSYAVEGADQRCSAYGWTYSFTDFKSGTSGELKLYLEARAFRKCVWRSQVSTHGGMVYDVGYLNGWLSPLKLISVEAAEVAVGKIALPNFEIKSVSLGAPGMMGPNQSPNPTYILVGNVGTTAGFYIVDAVTGVVRPGETPQ